ncbi:hypothetical protein NMY22_g7810 [Coprinellus aureogranulatus]|nr:hypothetical protein NMY22_g7810 [Coprinellus aureogranulatus]
MTASGTCGEENPFHYLQLPPRRSRIPHYTSSSPRTYPPPIKMMGEDVQNIPPAFKREGSDWVALFNPEVERKLDIKLVHSFCHASVVCSVHLSPDGRFLATGINRSAQIFNVATGQTICELPHDSQGNDVDCYVRSVRFSPDGNFLVTGGEDRKIRVWDIGSRTIRTIYDGHHREVYTLAFSRNGRLIVSGSGDCTARIWDTVDGSTKTFTIMSAEDLDPGVTSVAISPDSTLVAAGSLDGVARIWDVESGHLVEMLRGHEDSVYSIVFTPDGKGLVTASLDNTLRRWDISGLVAKIGQGSSGGLEEQMKNLAIGDSGLGLSPGFTWRTSESRRTDGTIGTSPSVAKFVGHKDFVLCVSMSSDGQWVVSGSKERTVRVWDAYTAAWQLSLLGHKNSVISVDVSGANGLLATGSGDWVARVWSLSPVGP